MDNSVQEDKGMPTLSTMATMSTLPENQINLKRKGKENKNNEKRKKQRKDYKQLCNETEYEIKNGKRYVIPYIYKHETFCKQRWLNKGLLDVYSKEFGAYSREYYEDAIKSGRIRVNGKQVTCDYCLKNGDKITHSVHRHEPPVPYIPITVIKETDDIIAINKPSAIPVHACGSYRYNTVEMIMRKELNLGDFYFIHRLDRVTSGVLLVARKKEIAASLSEELQKGGCHKVYLAIVEGELTFNKSKDIEGVDIIENKVIKVNRNIAIVSQRDGVMKCDATEGKPACTYIFPLYYSKTRNCTLVQCLPITGRTHQIRLHLKYLNHPIDDDFNYNDAIHIPKLILSLNDFINRREFREWKSIPKPSEDDSNLTEDEIVVKYCRWCHMSEDDMLHDLFKDEQINHTSIHLHAFSYTIHNNTFKTELPDWEIMQEVDTQKLQTEIDNNRSYIINLESTH